MPKPLMATARAYHDESKERNPDPQNKPQMFQKRSFWGKAQESSSNVEPRNWFGRAGREPIFMINAHMATAETQLEEWKEM